MAIDTLLNYLALEKALDVKNVARQLRMRRMEMIQNLVSLQLEFN